MIIISKVNKFLLILIATFSISNTLSAENLGVYGEVFQITEADMLTFIHNKLVALNDSGKLKKMQKEFNSRVVAHTLRPTPVDDITRSSVNKSFYYDPTLTVKNDVYDNNGNVIVQAGTHINPLDHIQFREILFFIDSDDKDQIEWVRKKSSQVKSGFTSKIILVKGNIVEAGHSLGRIYFDQNGTITKKFGIKHVPAMVYPAGKVLQIDEIKL